MNAAKSAGLQFANDFWNASAEEKGRLVGGLVVGALGAKGLGAVAKGLGRAGAVADKVGDAAKGAGQAGKGLGRTIDLQLFGSKGTPEFTTNAKQAMKRLGLSKREFNEAIHDIKDVVEGNPNMKFDLTTGDVYDQRSGELIGNLLDYVRRR